MSKKKKTRNNKSKSTLQNVSKYDIIRVDWEDHFSGNHAWVTSAKELNIRPVLCITVGVRVHEDKKTITLAQNMGSNETIADTTTVLKNCIVHRLKLGELIYADKG